MSNSFAKMLWVLLALIVGQLAARGDGSISGDSLIQAVKVQDRPTIALLLEKGIDVNTRQPDGATALHWATHRDDLSTVKQLIGLGAKVNLENDFGVTPLSLACLNGNAKIIRALIAGGADPNRPLLTGETPLMTASRTGDVKSVKVLLRNGANVNATEPVREQTALMWALAERQTETAQTLVKRGANIHAKTKLGFTPLLFSVREGDAEATQWLLELGADPNTQSKDKLSALHVATIRGHLQTALLLLEAGANPNASDPGFTALHWAVGTWETELNGANGIRAPKGHEWDRMRGVQEGKMVLTTALLEHGADPNARLKRTPPRYGFTVTGTSKDSTPLTLAAFAGEGAIMKLLVKHGADMSLKPENGLSPLLTAAGVARFRPENAVPEESLLSAIKAALELGADINEKGPKGNTALHGAAWLRSIKIVEFLVENGADIDAKNERKHNAIKTALRDGRNMGDRPELDHSPIADFLRQWQALQFEQISRAF